MEIIKRMVKDADIVVENFKVGTLDKMGLGYEDLKQVNPEIIFASISGFGQNGPLKDLAAYDNVVQSMSGVMEMTGFPDGVPTRVGPTIGDNFTGLMMSLAIVMAYYHKLNTGKGQRLDVAMMDTIFSILESPILFQTLLHQEETRRGNSDVTLVPYDVYPCKDGYFSAGLAGESGWDRFCNCIEMPELIEDERFVNNDCRCRNYDILTPIMTEFFKKKTKIGRNFYCGRYSECTGSYNSRIDGASADSCAEHVGRAGRSRRRKISGNQQSHENGFNTGRDGIWCAIVGTRYGKSNEEFWIYNGGDTVIDTTRSDCYQFLSE